MFIIESHTNPDILNEEINIPDYDIHRTDRVGRLKGGVLIYAMNSITSTQILSYSNSVCEVLIVKLHESDCISCVIYRPPNSKSGDFLPIVDMVREKLKDYTKSDIIICGDFNFPQADWSDPECRNTSAVTGDEKIQLSKLLNLTDDLFLQQLITKPTRDENTLDLLFTNITDSPLDCTISKYKTLSDHNLVELKLNHDDNDEKQIPGKPTVRNGYKKYNFYKADYVEINNDLNNINWQEELEDKPVDEQINTFNDILLNIISKHTAEIQPYKKRYKSKFYRERRAFWRRRNRVLTKRDSANRKKVLEEIEINIKKSHVTERLHNEHKAIDKISSNSKYFYTYANKSRKSKSKIGPLINKDTNEVISDPKEIAESLQTQYCSVFSKPDQTKHIENIQEFFNDGSANSSDHSILNDINFSEDDIITAIKKIKPNAAAGPDGIPTILLKECSQQLSKPLYIIFRHSLDSGEVPNLLKDAMVIPIHKGGLKSDVKNYRPVSLLSQILKILEKVLCVKIVSHLEENNILNDNQHGFRKFRSCLSQLIDHYDNILEAASAGNNVDVIYLDYSKAFDVVDHHILLRKLKDSGITGKLGTWINNFISGRKQTVTVNQTQSRCETVTSGVPQGSVLGPILFLIMISDIDTNIIKSTVSSFADDTKVSHVVQLRQDCLDLQTSLDSIYQWSDTNNLIFNSLKFQAIRYGNNKDNIDFSYKTPVGNNIPNEDSVKDLGIQMSCNMKFHDHIEKVASKCRSLSGWILRTFTTREAAPMLKLFNSLLLPRIDYCSQLWSPHRVGDWNKLEAIQRRFTSKIIDLQDLDYWSRLKVLRQYSLQRRAERYKILYCWKIMERLAPNLSTNPIEVRYSERRGRSCVIPKLINSQLCSAQINTIRENSFSIQGPRLFNCLPKKIRNITSVSVDTFKYHLDKLLTNIPDQPGVPGYAGSRAAVTNSIIDQICISGVGRIAAGL